MLAVFMLGLALGAIAGGIAIITTILYLINNLDNGEENKYQES